MIFDSNEHPTDLSAAFEPTARFVTDGGEEGTDADAEDDTDAAEAFVLVDSDAPSDRYRILVPILDSETDEREEHDIERLLGTASSLARARDGAVHLVNVVRFPEQTPLSHVVEEPQVTDARTDVKRLLDVMAEKGFSDSMEGSVCLAHKETRALLNLLAEREYDAVFLGTRDTTSLRRRLLRGDTVEGLLGNATCDVYVERFGDEPYVEELGSSAEDPHRLLLAVADSAHSDEAVEVARTLAAAVGARIDVIHCVPSEATERDIENATKLVEDVGASLHDVPETGTTVVKTDHAPEEILHRSNNYDVTILGAPRESLLQQFIHGSLPERVRLGAKNTVLMVQRGERRGEQ